MLRTKLGFFIHGPAMHIIFPDIFFFFFYHCRKNSCPGPAPVMSSQQDDLTVYKRAATHSCLSSFFSRPGLEISRHQKAFSVVFTNCRNFKQLCSCHCDFSSRGSLCLYIAFLFFFHAQISAYGSHYRPENRHRASRLRNGEDSSMNLHGRVAVAYTKGFKSI